MASQLWSPGDIARHFGVSRQAVYKWRQGGGFPAPVASPGGIDVFDPAAVKAWERARRSDKDHRRGAVKGRYRQLAGQPGALAQVAKEVGINERTARRWLQAMGEIE